MSTAPEVAPSEVHERSWEPHLIDSIEDTGLSLGFISDMALKILYLRGQLHGSRNCYLDAVAVLLRLESGGGFFETGTTL